METSVIYTRRAVYTLAMRLLYGRHFDARYRVVADLVPAGADVLDLCCGPPLLFARYLRAKGVPYRGLDLSDRFIEELRREGGEGQTWDLRSEIPLPGADCVIMQAALYHFLPRPTPVLDRMFASARRRVIIAEPIRNLTDSSLPVVRWLSSRLTDPGSGEQSHRFTEQTLDELLAEHRPSFTFLIPGGREKVYLFEKSSFRGE